MKRSYHLLGSGLNVNVLEKFVGEIEHFRRITHQLLTHNKLLIDHKHFCFC